MLYVLGSLTFADYLIGLVLVACAIAAVAEMRR